MLWFDSGYFFSRVFRAISDFKVNNSLDISTKKLSRFLAKSFGKPSSKCAFIALVMLLSISDIASSLSVFPISSTLVTSLTAIRLRLFVRFGQGSPELL